MTLSNEQLEWIVQEVMRRLAGNISDARTPSGREIVVEQQLITTHTLAGSLEDVALVRVSRRAVVTPSAKDMLRDRGVELATVT